MLLIEHRFRMNRNVANWSISIRFDFCFSFSLFFFMSLCTSFSFNIYFFLNILCYHHHIPRWLRSYSFFRLSLSIIKLVLFLSSGKRKRKRFGHREKWSKCVKLKTNLQTNLFSAFFNWNLINCQREYCLRLRFHSLSATNCTRLSCTASGWDDKRTWFEFDLWW